LDLNSRSEISLTVRSTPSTAMLSPSFASARTLTTDAQHAVARDDDLADLLEDPCEHAPSVKGGVARCSSDGALLSPPG